MRSSRHVFFESVQLFKDLITMLIKPLGSLCATGKGGICVVFLLEAFSLFRTNSVVVKQLQVFHNAIRRVVRCKWHRSSEPCSRNRQPLHVPNGAYSQQFPSIL